MRITISANDLQWKETPLINAVIKQVIKLGNFQFRKQMNRSKKFMKWGKVCWRRIGIGACSSGGLGLKRDVELNNGKPSMCPNYLAPSPTPLVTVSKLLKALSQFLAWKVMLSWEMLLTHAHFIYRFVHILFNWILSINLNPCHWELLS